MEELQRLRETQLEREMLKNGATCMLLLLRCSQHVRGISISQVPGNVASGKSNFRIITQHHLKPIMIIIYNTIP